MPVIKVSDKNKSRMDSRKIHPRMSYDEVIGLMLDHIEAQEKRKK